MKMHMSLSITQDFFKNYYKHQQSIISHYQDFMTEVNASPTLKMLLGEMFIDLICNLFTLDRKHVYDSMAVNFDKDNDEATWTATDNTEESEFNTLLQRFDNVYVKANCLKSHTTFTDVVKITLVQTHWKEFVRGIVDNVYDLLCCLHTNIHNQTEAELLLNNHHARWQAKAKCQRDLPENCQYLYKEGGADNPCAVFVWADHTTKRLCLSSRDKSGNTNHTYFNLLLDYPAIEFLGQQPPRVYSGLSNFISASFAFSDSMILGDLNEAEEIDLASIVPFCFRENVENEDEQVAQFAATV